MFQSIKIASQPLFYLFIAVTVLLTLGYSWGRRRNNRIYLSAFNALVNILRPKDQTFTNIGGFTGFHATLIPKKKEMIKKVEATITLLPRQAWLYLPLSLIFRRFDRLFITITLAKRKGGKTRMAEGHLIEKKFSQFRGPKIQNEEKLNKQELLWGDRAFYIYYENDEVRHSLRSLMNQVRSPGDVRHVAVVPSQERVFIFMIPRVGRVEKNVKPLFSWLSSSAFYLSE